MWSVSAAAGFSSIAPPPRSSCRRASRAAPAARSGADLSRAQKGTPLSNDLLQQLAERAVKDVFEG
jgi:hypothetical protein